MAVLRCLLLAAVLAAVWGCGAGHLDRRTRDSLRGATRVEVFRIDGMTDPFEKARPEEKRIDGYSVIAQGKDRGKEFGARLADLLDDRGTYSDAYAKCYQPGVAFRAWKGEEAADILICFMCDNLYYGPPTDRARENASFLGSPRRAAILRLAKEALPDDAEIQALRDK
jgi:hypothetical protein